MPLSPADRDRVKFHLGYTGTSTAAAIQFGFALPMQTLFLVEEAMNRIPEVAIPRIHNILGTLDNIVFCRIPESMDYLAAERLGEMTLRGAARGLTHPDLLRRELVFWAGMLCDTLGVPFYPFSARFSRHGGAGNGRVTR